ncbi:hypothetical protein LUZ60_017700 [Juncus effusus]|nr:hypothetical protein LUZ60_017700 [Juncus effusus]
MGFFAKHLIISHASVSSTTTNKKAPKPEKPNTSTRRSALTSAGIFLAVSSALNVRRPAEAEASEDIKWGTKSYTWEKYFSPGLSPEDSVARIRQTAEGMKGMREMLERMSWKYVLLYVRLRSAYLETDLKTVMEIVPEGRRNDYVKAANQLVDDMSELDRFIRTPKVYESYVYYEKTLKSLDELMEFFA